jgi:LysM repeat protein
MGRILRLIVVGIAILFLLFVLVMLLNILFVIYSPNHTSPIPPDITLPPWLEPLQMGPSYGIQNQKLGVCNQSEIAAQSCNLTGQGDQVCFAWTEHGRDPGESLSILLHDSQENLVFQYDEADPISTTCKELCCRVLPVTTPLPPGKYTEVVFLLAGWYFHYPIDWTSTQVNSILPFIPKAELTLTKKAFPATYSRVGDNIRYDYVITNTGDAIWQGSMTITDDSKVEVKCQTVNSIGNRNDSFDPSEAVPCYATYIIKKADIEAGSVTSTASLEGADPATTKITSGCQPPKDWVIYEIRSTDTLDEISTWYSDLTLEKLMQANCLNTATISPGQKIYVPSSPLPAKIRGIVFMDPNHNDIQDRNELGLSGAPVKITDSNGAIVATPMTGANGVFEIDLPPGTYFVFQFQVILRPGEVRNQKFAVVPVP